MNYQQNESEEYSKMTKEELIAKIEELSSANVSKNTFIANISHEVRTPMNAILGFSELILQLAASPEVDGYANEIKSASNNLLAIINDLLDISKMESGKMELSPVPYYLHYLFGDVESVVSIPIQKKNLELRMNISPEMPSQLYGDIVRIRQILINIVNNAVKFTKEGYIELRAKSYDKVVLDNPDEEWLKDLSDEIDSVVTLEFQIADTGIGIKKEDLHKIFDKFQQVDSRVNRGIEGTGLGLSISSQLVGLMHGEIIVESEYGVGTVFTVRIPQKVLNRQKFSNYMVSHAAEEKKTKHSFYAPGARILVVDDNPVNVRVLTGLLAHYEIEATACESGFDAIEAVKNSDYDLIFMDHMMPMMDGVEANHIIRELQKDKSDKSVTIAVSANAIRGVSDFFVSEGFDDYMSKPIEVDRLAAILKKHLKKELIIEETVEETPESETTIDFEIEGIDIDAGLSKSANNVGDYLEILDIVRECGPEKADEIMQLAEAKDYTNYTIAVHALKSVAANIGAHQLYTMAKIHEMAGKGGQTDFIDKNYKKLLSLYVNIIERINLALEENKVE